MRRSFLFVKGLKKIEMKKTLIVSIGLLVAVAITIVLFPEILFSSPFVQKMYLKYDGDRVAEFYYKNDGIVKDTIYMRGVIYGNTLHDIQGAFDKNPKITTLVMEDVPGSIDDEVNLVASLEIRKRQINTYIPNDGMVASGGTDMFLAGKERAVHPTAKVGVHSWAGMDSVALDFPRAHKEHEKYLDYYREMGIPLDFYWYTLEAAPADSIHWMTTVEMNQYRVVTSPFTVEPSGSRTGTF